MCHKSKSERHSHANESKPQHAPNVENTEGTKIAQDSWKTRKTKQKKASEKPNPANTSE